VIIADTLWLRLRGLLFRYDWKGGMLLPTKSIHTFFMHQSLDVYYLDREGKVIKALMDFPPNHISPIVKEAAMVLEVPVGALGNALPGERFYIHNQILGGYLNDRIFV
jgi:uncharacterized membrane protein (UPF0127 family)